MISRQEWDAWNEDERWIFLYRHAAQTEEAVDRLSAALGKFASASRLTRRPASGKRSLACKNSSSVLVSYKRRWFRQ
jgi:hypothetical protein